MDKITNKNIRITEKVTICNACMGYHTIVMSDTIKSLNLYFYNYLRQYDLLNICEDCFNESYRLFLNDEEEFMDWLDENDNRKDNELTVMDKWRKEYKVTADILESDIYQYVENLERYSLMLENKLVSGGFVNAD